MRLPLHHPGDLIQDPRAVLRRQPHPDSPRNLGLSHSEHRPRKLPGADLREGHGRKVDRLHLGSRSVEATQLVPHAVVDAHQILAAVGPQPIPERKTAAPHAPGRKGLRPQGNLHPLVRPRDPDHRVAHEVEGPCLSLPSSGKETRGHGEVPGSSSGPAVSPDKLAVRPQSDKVRLSLVQDPDGTVARDLQVARNATTDRCAATRSGVIRLADLTLPTMLPKSQYCQL